MDRNALLDGTALDDERAGRGDRPLLGLVRVIRIIRIVGVVGLGGLAQLRLIALETRQLDLEVRAGGVLPCGAEGDW